MGWALPVMSSRGAGDARRGARKLNLSSRGAANTRRGDLGNPRKLFVRRDSLPLELFKNPPQLRDGLVVHVHAQIDLRPIEMVHHPQPGGTFWSVNAAGALTARIPPPFDTA